MDMPTNLIMQVIVEEADLLPSYAHPGDAGLDLRAAHNGIVMPGEVRSVDTGIKVAIPEGFVGLVNPRSGLASKGVTVANAPGTVDSGYRGDLKVLLINHSAQVFNFKRLDRIAQLVLVPYLTANIAVVSSFKDKTSRGSNGFGSTGVA